MSGSLARVAAIVRVDFLVRFRRVSTVIVFLLLSAFAYVWLPAPSTGRALIQINDHRAIYNSGAIGMGTASLGMVFVGLFGFYVISSAIRKDVVTRCGLVAASTPMRSSEYLLGKFFGNVCFLTTFLGGFMLSSMAMVLVRGEAPIEPLVFIGQYLLLTPSAVVFVSAAAVLFESIPFLSGKLGDVAYFFFWLAFLGLVIGDEASQRGISWARYFDFTGSGFMTDQLSRTLHTNSVSIGASTFDPQKAPIVFPGLALTRAWVLPRLVSTFAPLLLLPVAALFFHRFDPVRTKQTSEKSSRNWIGRLQNLLRPISARLVAPLLLPARGGSFLVAMWADAVLTLTLYPLALVALFAITIASLAASLPLLMPGALAALAIIVSNVATRDVRANTTAALRSMPRLRENFVWWKLGSTLLLGLLLGAGPLVRAALGGTLPFAALLGGIVFVAATATSLGVMTRNPKTFIVIFLSFWYLVVNDHGASPWLDFAGFYGSGRAGPILGYAAGSALAVALAEGWHRLRLRSA
ncbi:MAG: hypothetical protein H0V54_01270 [Chthoniobacterales bacterium]|nr:hypothetical protein [Chthoniobacterales bacterium]